MDRVFVPEERLMHRFYADPFPGPGSLVYLSPEDARHAVTVLRLKPGQHIEIISDFRRWEAEIAEAAGNTVSAAILSCLPSTEASLSVTLYQGLPKADKMDMIVQKATELGVVRIVPVLMSRCVVRPDPKDVPRKLERWRKIAREAGKQSGRCLIPEISEPVTLNRIADPANLPELNVVPWEEAAGYGPLSFRSDHPVLSSLGIVIGPEGGIEPDEVSRLQSAGFVPITLGKRILRTETAGLAAVSSFMGLYGEME